MNKTGFSYQNIILPILFILFSISIITAYNIIELNKYKKIETKKAKDSYLKEQKEIIKNKTDFLKNVMKYQKAQVKETLKKEIKLKVEQAYAISIDIYNRNKNELTKQQIIKRIISTLEKIKFSSKEGYYFMVDYDNNRIVMNNVKRMVGMDLTSYRDTSGKLIIKEQKELLSKNNGTFQYVYFPRASKPNLQAPKILYLKHIKELNLMLGTGEYLDDAKLMIKKNILQILKNMHKDEKYYFVVLDILKKTRELTVLYNGHYSFKDNIKVPFSEVIDKSYTNKINELFSNLIIKDNYFVFKSNSNIYKEKEKKMAYFTFDKEWNWLYGAIFYFEDLNNEIKKIDIEFSKNINEQIKRGILVALFLSFFLSLFFYFISKKATKTIDKYSSLLEEQKNIFKLLYEKSADGIFLIKNDKFFDCNNSILRMLKFSNKEQLLDKSPFEISPIFQPNKISSENEAKRLIDLAIKKGSVNFEWVFLKLNKQEFWCDITLTRIDLNNELIIYALIRDINEKKFLEEQTKQQDSLLSQQSKMAAMGEMIGNIAHQWRQPLSAITTLASSMQIKKELNMVDEKEELDSLSSIMSTSKYLSKTIDDFRDFFNPNKEISLYLLDEAMNKTLELLKAQFSSNNIKIILNMDRIEHYGYENELIQVLVNILNNSRDAFKNSADTKLIFVDIYKNGSEGIILIKDSAGGISEEILDRIFEPYFTTKHQKQGTGIGLYMCEEIIKKHMNGKIEVSNCLINHENINYKGARFKISLPLK